MPSNRNDEGMRCRQVDQEERGETGGPLALEFFFDMLGAKKGLMHPVE